MIIIIQLSLVKVLA